ncbi:MAG: SUMF1/EgtB/PvdO family nonheme iron enzyme, partial [Chloroflexota bacterium]
LVVGFFPGLLCGSLIIFAMLFTGFLDGFSAQPEVIEITAPPVQIVQVVTSTPDPAATEAVMVVTATPDENAVAQSETTGDENTDTGDEATSDTTDTQDTGTSAIVQPSLTPFTAANTAVAVNSDTNTTDNTDAQAAAETEAVQPTPVPQSNPASADTTGGAGIPAQLAAIAGNLVQVSGGQFTMGADQLEIIQAVENCVNRDGGLCQVSYGDDSRPQVQVQLDTFWIEQNEVTFEQYVAFLNYQNSQGLRHTGGCSNLLCIQTQNERPNAAVIAWDGANYFIPANFQAVLNHPAYGVTWYGAQAYCNALGRRLPTEAEWEYAARSGGNTVIYPWGDSWSLELANVRIPAIEGSGGATEAVDSRIGGVNPLGLTHMAGNVAEWVSDYYDLVYYQTLSQQQQSTGQPVVNPQGPLGGTRRVLRGGSFDTPPFFARTVHRQAWFPAPEDDNGDFPLWVGFRCASDTGPQTNTPNAGNPVDPASLQATIPASGSTDTNAQPTLAAPP